MKFPFKLYAIQSKVTSKETTKDKATKKSNEVWCHILVHISTSLAHLIFSKVLVGITNMQLKVYSDAKPLGEGHLVLGGYLPWKKFI